MNNKDYNFEHFGRPTPAYSQLFISICTRRVSTNVGGYARVDFLLAGMHRKHIQLNKGIASSGKFCCYFIAFSYIFHQRTVMIYNFYFLNNHNFQCLLIMCIFSILASSRHKRHCYNAFVDDCRFVDLNNIISCFSTCEFKACD